MRDRSFGVTVLAFSSIMIALYSQFAAIALILIGSVYTAAGSAPAAFVLMLGAVFLGLTFASYFLGYGFWTKKHWSFAAGVTLFVSFVVANVLLSVISTNFISSIVPALAAVVGVWYLHRPAVKAELLDEAAPTSESLPRVDTLEGAEPAR